MLIIALIQGDRLSKCTLVIDMVILSSYTDVVLVDVPSYL